MDKAREMYERGVADSSQYSGLARIFMRQGNVDEAKSLITPAASATGVLPWLRYCYLKRSPGS